jgi:hypothetical protein
VPEHRPVDLLQHVLAYPNAEGGRFDAQHADVERNVVDLAQRQPVRDDGLSTLRVREDVRSVQQLPMPEPTDAAADPVRLHHTLAEAALMQPLPCQAGRVLAASFVVPDQARPFERGRELPLGERPRHRLGLHPEP